MDVADVDMMALDEEVREYVLAGTECTDKGHNMGALTNARYTEYLNKVEADASDADTVGGLGYNIDLLGVATNVVTFGEEPAPLAEMGEGARRKNALFLANSGCRFLLGHDGQVKQQSYERTRVDPKAPRPWTASGFTAGLASSSPS